MGIDEIEVGRTYPCKGGKIKIMAFVDGYWMCRRPGCIPFVANKRKLQELF